MTNFEKLIEDKDRLVEYLSASEAFVEMTDSWYCRYRCPNYNTNDCCMENCTGSTKEQVLEWLDSEA